MRYAIYFTPAENDALSRKASRWLGRDAFTDTIHNDHSDYAEITAEPRRYGFHATLKAPFTLADDRNEDELLAALESFVRSRHAFDIPRVIIGNLGPFFAIVPDETHQPLQNFAADVVTHFESFRAPLSDADIARRRPQDLSESQRRNLVDWGYPHVMDDFRFHMTLTGPVDVSNRAHMSEVLNAEFSDFTNRLLPISGLGLFVEPARGQPFRVHTWLPLLNANEHQNSVQKEVFP